VPGIQEVGSTGAGRWARVCLYNYPGTRKTSLIGDGTAGKVLIIRSPMDNIPARILKNKNVQEWVVSTWEEMSGDSDSVLQYMQHEGHEWDWIWVDCFSIMQDVLLDDVWAATVADKPHRAALTPAGGMAQGEYWRNAERLQQFIRHAFGSSGFHFGITCHLDEGDHPDNPEITVLRPFIHVRGMVQKICGYMNVVGYLQLKEDDKDVPYSRLNVRESPHWYAKDLYDAFPKGYIDNPTLGEFTAAIEAAYKGTAPKPRSSRRKTASAPRRGTGQRPKKTATAGRRRGREQ